MNSYLTIVYKIVDTLKYWQFFITVSQEDFSLPL